MKNFRVARLMFLAVCMLAGTVYAEPVTKPYTFTPGTAAKANEVNENFDVLYNKSNELDSKVDQLCDNSQTKKIFVGGGAFKAISGNVYYGGEFDGYAPTIWSRSSNINPTRVQAMINLPDSAWIQTMTLKADNNTPIENTSCRLEQWEFPQIPPTRRIGLLEAQASGINSEEYQVVDGVLISPFEPTDNSRHAYRILCTLPNPANTGAFGMIYGVYLEYTLSSQCQ